jgi:L-histidine Nalpha-methyltransferase
MPLASVHIHSSQFPENVRRDLLHSLRSRHVNHKFHYDSHKQARQWLALHEAFSPSRTDADCAAMYDLAFAAAAQEAVAARVQVIGLGCGGGQKDARLVRLLAERGTDTSYAPCDASVPLVLTAREAVLQAAGELQCDPLVCDLGTIADLPAIFHASGQEPRTRLITFFGMIPNFEPGLILPRLAELTSGGDWLLMSANLVPGPDTTAGMRRILPGYDNPPTRDWLTMFLFDLGFEPADGTVRFSIEAFGEGCRRVAADFCMAGRRAVKVEGEIFEFNAGEKIRLFFSCRYTPDQIAALLAIHQLEVREQWVSQSGEEGIFLCRKA